MSETENTVLVSTRVVRDMRRCEEGRAPVRDGNPEQAGAHPRVEAQHAFVLDGLRCDLHRGLVSSIRRQLANARVAEKEKRMTNTARAHAPCGPCRCRRRRSSTRTRAGCHSVDVAWAEGLTKRVRDGIGEAEHSIGERSAPLLFLANTKKNMRRRAGHVASRPACALTTLPSSPRSRLQSPPGRVSRSRSASFCSFKCVCAFPSDGSVCGLSLCKCAVQNPPRSNTSLPCAEGRSKATGKHHGRLVRVLTGPPGLLRQRPT